MPESKVNFGRISNLIENQFPAYYRENGPFFIEFVKEYYKWMESNRQALYYSRRFYDDIDIDLCADEFLKYFKNKYLINITFDTKADIRQLVKHALDIYRSKGSERSIKLLFQLVYNEEIELYYPSSDLFRLSDGEWNIPNYIELTHNENNYNLFQKQIVGIDSGATAFVDNIVRKKIHNKFIDIAYISAIKGRFYTNEYIKPSDGSLDGKTLPSTSGSMNSITIAATGSGSGFKVGDIVDIISEYGEGGKGRVSNTGVIDGFLNYNFLDGGYGYSETPDVYVSNNVLILENVKTTNNQVNYNYRFLDSIIQPMKLLHYNSSSDLLFDNEVIYSYYANGSQRGLGVIMYNDQTDTSSGQLLVSLVSGSLQNTIYTTANAISANVYLIEDATSNAQLIANNNDYTVRLSSATKKFKINETFTQTLPGTAESISVGYVKELGKNEILVEVTEGALKTGINIVGAKSNAVGNVESLSFSVGIVNVHNVFVSSVNNYVYTNNFTGSVTSVSKGTNTSITLSNVLEYPEFVNVNIDIIKGYINVHWNDLAYGFPGNTSANIGTNNIGTILSWSNIQIGKISGIVAFDPGENYNAPVMVAVNSPYIVPWKQQDFKLNISNQSSNFTIGEIITQESTGGRGMIMEGSNSSVLLVQRLRLFSNNDFIPTVNAATEIVGDMSAVTANVDSVSIYKSLYTGQNADITSELDYSDGSILSVDVTDSGFAYLPNDYVTITKTGIINDAEGYVNLGNHGFGSGYYKTKGGNLSDTKKLFDGYYYQNFSYEIISSIQLDKYKEMLKQIAHPIGVKMFGKISKKTKDNNEFKIIKSKITVT